MNNNPPTPRGTRVRMELASRVPPGLVDEQRAVSLAWIARHFNPEIGPPTFLIAERDVVGGSPADIRPHTYAPWQLRLTYEPERIPEETRFRPLAELPAPRHRLLSLRDFANLGAVFLHPDDILAFRLTDAPAEAGADNPA